MRSTFLTLSVLSALATPGAAGAKMLHVSTRGMDSPFCGSLAEPCRSLGRAIGNAAPRDKILVGPGRYGDLDGDGLFQSAGEESLGTVFAMIVVDKMLTIESTRGAGGTILDAGGADLSVLQIDADGVRFGGARKGFTLRRGRNGLEVRADRVQVSGNLAVDNTRWGFEARFSSASALRGNQAIGNSELGFLLGGNGIVAIGNLAVANGDGFALQGSGNIARANAASGNDGHGIRISEDGHVVRGNVISGNLFGVAIGGTGHVLAGNAILANVNDGIGLLIGSQASVTGNNIVGNGGCGLNNRSDVTITATGNFWGSPTGPGVDPADTVCGSGTTVFEPFATRERLVQGSPLF